MRRGSDDEELQLVRARRTCIARAEHAKAHVVCGGADGSIGAYMRRYETEEAMARGASRQIG